MNHPSHDEAMAAYALTSLDRGNSNIQKEESKKPPASKPKHPARVTKKTQGSKGVPKTVPIQVIPKKGNYINHSYADFSSVPNDTNYKLPEDLEALSFAEKLHVVLSTPEYHKCISWLPHGRAFRVSIPAIFEKTVCPKFFGHKRFSSFLRQLNNHGFKHLTSGTSRNGYYHECFLRGVEHCVQFMPRPKDARRQVPDPANEPNFDEISKAYPLPQVSSRVAALHGELTEEEQKAQAILDPSKPDATASKTRTYSTMAGPIAQESNKKPAHLLPPPPNAPAQVDWLAIALRTQQQLQLQQQLHQVLSQYQQGDSATEQLLRSLYNNGLR